MKDTPFQESTRASILRKYALILAGWSLLVLGSLAWNSHQIEHTTLRTATATARASLTKDIAFRNWANSHGGVYVPPTPRIPPNPYLKTPVRDVITTSGVALTLMNPAYVIRDVQQNFSDELGIKSHLTSLKLFNPNNAPDEWERKALLSFEHGEPEAMEIGLINEQPYLRLMLPLKVQEGCLKCHDKQGYKIGDNRGGIGASVPLKPFIAAGQLQRNELSWSHGLIWLIGLLGIVAVYRREQWTTAQRISSHAELIKLSQAVEQSPNAIIITNLAADIEYINQSFIHQTGYNREEVLGKNPRILHSGKTPPQTFVALWANLTQGKTWEGEIINKRKDGTEYIEWVKISPVLGANGLIAHYLAVKEDITERRASEEKIHVLAYYDELTHLPNRRLMMDRLQQAAAASTHSKQSGALLFIDLDHFKTINETKGYDIGDLLLLEVSRRLSANVREGETVARLGSDEFIVILAALDPSPHEAATQARQVAEKLQVSLSQPYQLNQFVHSITPSIGIVTFHGHQHNWEELLKHAEVAMHEAKATGRDAICFHDHAMQTTLETRAELESELRIALEQQQFELYYQVQVDSNHRALGAEALIRWQHPAKGTISPNAFIPLAEEMGIIIPIGRWALQTACVQLKKWQQDANTSHLTVSVNVSVKQFRQADFVQQVRHVLLETGAKPAHLKLELTESILLSNVEDIIEKMQALKLLGIHFSMDDFGTGYSSLQYIKRLPLDQLKIDQSFVRDIATDTNDAAIVQTIIAMSDALGLSVIAEGVENQEQRDFLSQHGCHTFQGYLFGRPLPVTNFETALKRHQ
ncbi:MAG: EAL domain-containing protein [Gallionella sp.]|nr:EAL domain-containing protein [Gallionella sp.]